VWRLNTTRKRIPSAQKGKGKKVRVYSFLCGTPLTKKERGGSSEKNQESFAVSENTTDGSPEVGAKNLKPSLAEIDLSK